jgi:ABC-type proline/glycine betaine transport system permease subunit
VAPLLQIVFGLSLRWLPVGSWEGGAPAHLVLPVVTLALPQVGTLARLTRAALAEVLAAQPIRTQRAMGLPPHRIARHALRAALLPVVAILGPTAAALLTGSVVVETIFGLPGIGRYFVDGALNRDYTLVMGTVILVALFVIALNIVADLLSGLLDPRLRARRRSACLTAPPATVWPSRRCPCSRRSPWPASSDPSSRATIRRGSILISCARPRRWRPTPAPRRSDRRSSGSPSACG